MFLFLTQIPILIFLGRLSEFFNFLKNTVVFLQVESFLFPLSEKGLLPKDTHILTDALVESPRNLFSVEKRLCWKRFPSLSRKVLPNGDFDFHGGWDPWNDWDDDVDWPLLNFNVVNNTNTPPPHSASVMSGSFEKAFCHWYSSDSFYIFPSTLSFS